MECEMEQPVIYEELHLDAGYRLGMVFENCVIVENKSVEKILPVYQAQLLTYLRLRDYRPGFLINWNVHLIKDGIHRMVNNL